MAALLTQSRRAGSHSVPRVTPYGGKTALLKQPKHAYAWTRMQTRTHTHGYERKSTHMHGYERTRTQKHARTHTHGQARTCTDTNTKARTDTNANARTCMDTDAKARTRTDTDTHACTCVARFTYCKQPDPIARPPPQHMLHGLHMYPN